MATVRIALILFLAMSIGSSCREGFDQDQSQARYCDVNDPVNELEWLRTQAAELQRTTVHMDAFIYTATYRSERVFYAHICCPSCGVAPPEVKNCEGTSLGRLGDDVDPNELAGTAMIWRTVNGVCQGS